MMLWIEVITIILIIIHNRDWSSKTLKVSTVIQRTGLRGDFGGGCKYEVRVLGFGLTEGKGKGND